MRLATSKMKSGRRYARKVAPSTTPNDARMAIRLRRGDGRKFMMSRYYEAASGARRMAFSLTGKFITVANRPSPMVIIQTVL